MSDYPTKDGYPPGGNDDVIDIQGAPPEGENPPDYETIMNMPDYTDLPPPPEYTPPPIEGVAPPPPDHSGPYLPPLAYADFLPRITSQPSERIIPTFENFRTVMSIVNDWLRQNPQYRVLRVEDLERRINEKTWQLETETTVQHQPMYGSTFYIRGIRLWLVPNTGNLPPQQLWYMNVVPKAIPIPVHVYQRMYGGFRMSMGVGTVMYFPDFETLGKTVDKLNAKFKQEPLPGRILSVVSSDIKYSESWSGRSFDPDRGMWQNKESRNKLYLTILRVYFVIGDPEPVEMGVRDFAPSIDKRSNTMMGKPILEGRDSVLQRASYWLRQQQGICVTSVQTVESKVRTNMYAGMMGMLNFGNEEICDTGEEQRHEHIRINPSSTSYQAGFGEAIFARTIRIFYLKRAPPTNQMTLTLRDFCPTRYGRVSAQTTSEVAIRINSWLHHTGARVVGVDTLRFQFTPESKFRIRTEESRSICQPMKSNHWITTIRVYLDGEIKEPPEEVRAGTPAYVTGDSGSGCCTIL